MRILDVLFALALVFNVANCIAVEDAYNTVPAFVKFGHTVPDQNRTWGNVTIFVVHSTCYAEGKDCAKDKDCCAAPNHYSVSGALKQFNDSNVSSNWMIAINGSPYYLVPAEYIAWANGVSYFDGKNRTNPFALSAELIKNQTEPVSYDQYYSLAHLINDSERSWNVTVITRHGDIAPDRKTDPWNFDWYKFLIILNTLEKRSVYGPHWERVETVINIKGEDYTVGYLVLKSPRKIDPFLFLQTRCLNGIQKNGYSVNLTVNCRYCKIKHYGRRRREGQC